MSELRAAIDNFDLEGFLLEHGGEKKQTHEWTLTCPHCAAPKLIVNTRKRTWHCWRCQKFDVQWTGDRYKRVVVQGAGGLLQLVMALERCTRPEAEMRVLRGNVRRPGSLLQVDLTDVATEPQAHGPAPAIPPPPGVEPFRELHPYLYQRGITWADVQSFGLTHCTWGRYRNRVVFPVFEGGRLVYWQARAMWEGSGPDFVKSLNPPKSVGGVTSAQTLFNYDQAVIVGRGLVCITEGPIDAIHAGPDAVATFGKQLTGVQIAKLMKAGVDRVDVMWDADASAEAALAAQRIAALFRVRLVQLPQGDPGDWPREALMRMRQQAPLVERGSRLARV